MGTQRVETAKQLLQASDAPLLDVAMRVGFRTPGHFTGVFHRYAGCTPRAFRMECRFRGDLPGG